MVESLLICPVHINLKRFKGRIVPKSQQIHVRVLRNIRQVSLLRRKKCRRIIRTHLVALLVILLWVLCTTLLLLEVLWEVLPRYLLCHLQHR